MNRRKKLLKSLGLSLGLVFAILLGGVSETSSGEPTGSSTILRAHSEEGRPVVLVELFTSQGCSSCPPADQLLTHMGESSDFAGVDTETVPLSYHVDYWNRIGWADPFSSPDWSIRQRRYATALHLHSVYTPQMVINGAHEFVGSNVAKAVEVISAQKDRRSPGWVELAVDRKGLEQRRLEIDVAARWEDAPVGSSAYAVVVLYENGLVTEVLRGENARLTLSNNHVVRSLKRAFLLKSEDRTSASKRVVFDLAEEWNEKQLGVVAFLQSRETMEIFSAIQIDLTG